MFRNISYRASHVCLFIYVAGLFICIKIYAYLIVLLFGGEGCKKKKID